MTAIDLPAAVRTGRRRPGWDRASLGLLAVAALLVLLTFRDYGVTWDEDVHNWYGVFVLDYYRSGFADHRALDWLNLYIYGAAFDMIAALVNLVSPFGTYPTRHLLNGLVGVLGLAGAWQLGRQMGGPRAGFLALVLLATIPNYYGQMFNNPKDIPFAVGTIWSLHYLARLVEALPRPPFGLVARLGVAIGLSLGVRVGGLLLLFYAGLALGTFCLWRAVEARRPGLAVAEAGRLALRVGLPVVVIAYPVMLLFWPWAQQDPIGHPLQSLDYFSHVTFPFPTLFAGRYVPAEHLPWAYLPTFIVLNLPELTLALALAALPLALSGWARRPDRTRVIQEGVLALAILFPVGYAVAIRAVLFDGMRHFIFVLPPIAVAAALVADRVIERVGRSPVRAPLAGLAALYGLGHLAIMVGLHPDEYVYYNGLVGGVAGAQSLFKTDYWGNSYAEAVRGLAAYLEREDGAGFAAHRVTVAVCGPPISATAFFPDNFVFEPDHAKADFFIAFTKDGCDKSLPGKEVYRVERMGALLSVVLDRRALKAAS